LHDTTVGYLLQTCHGLGS